MLANSNASLVGFGGASFSGVAFSASAGGSSITSFSGSTCASSTGAAGSGGNSGISAMLGAVTGSAGTGAFGGIGAIFVAMLAGACVGAGSATLGGAAGFTAAMSGVGRTESVLEVFSRSGQPIARLEIPNVTTNDPARMPARYQLRSCRAKFVARFVFHERWTRVAKRYTLRAWPTKRRPDSWVLSVLSPAFPWVLPLATGPEITIRAMKVVRAGPAPDPILVPRPAE